MAEDADAFAADADNQPPRDDANIQFYLGEHRGLMAKLKSLEDGSNSQFLGGQYDRGQEVLRLILELARVAERLDGTRAHRGRSQRGRLSPRCGDVPRGAAGHREADQGGRTWRRRERGRCVGYASGP